MKENRVVAAGEFYRHFKDKLYQVKTIAYHSETKEKMVVYQAMYGSFQMYVRPYDMFISEVEHDKYPEVKQKYRFEKVELHNDANDKFLSDNIYETTPYEEYVDEDSVDENNESKVDSRLLMFLDARDYNDKLNVLTALKGKLDDKLIDDIATVIDVTVPEGPLDKRYASLKSCILAHAKYEGNRLR